MACLRACLSASLRLCVSTCLQCRQCLQCLRVSAVDGKKIPTKPFRKITHANLGWFRSLGMGEIGCYLSHRKCWKKFLSSDADFVLILEDDFTLQPHFSKSLEWLIQTMEPHDFVKLQGSKKARALIAESEELSTQLVKFRSIPARTLAQVLTRPTAESLLRESKRFGRPIDVDLKYQWEFSPRILNLLPESAIPCEEDSLIGKRKTGLNLFRISQRLLIQLTYSILCRIHWIRHSSHQK